MVYAVVQDRCLDCAVMWLAFSKMHISGVCNKSQFTVRVMVTIGGVASGHQPPVIFFRDVVSVLNVSVSRWSRDVFWNVSVSSQS